MRTKHDFADAPTDRCSRHPGQAKCEPGSKKGIRFNPLRSRIRLCLSGMTSVERAASGMIIRWPGQRTLLSSAGPGGGAFLPSFLHPGFERSRIGLKRCADVARTIVCKNMVLACPEAIQRPLCNLAGRGFAASHPCRHAGIDETGINANHMGTLRFQLDPHRI